MTEALQISPITITSLLFAGFTAVIILLYYAFPKRQNPTLLAASYVFYATWDWRFALVLIFLTALNYIIAHRLDYSQRVKSNSAKRLLWAGLLINLGTLFYFKYLDYLVARLAGFFRLPETFNSLEIILPIGLSFYILQALSYLVDVYRGQLAPSDKPLEFALYMAYFPKLLSGPIERARGFLPQLSRERIVDNQVFAKALARIGIGLVRKLVIANTLLANIPHKVFEKPGESLAPDLLFWWVVFVFMIYNDFAGYTSIVRGVSGLFGIELAENFKQPIFAASFIDVWNRWHMSLSAWLRDYIYLPFSRVLLRRNPSGKYLPNIFIPPILTMLASGLWHGINPHFLLWGGLTGFVQALERFLTLRRPAVKRAESRPPRFSQALTGLGIMLTVSLLIGPPFLLEVPETLGFWSRLVVWGAAETLGPRVILRPIAAVILSLCVDWGQHKTQDDIFFVKWPRWAQSLALAVAILLIFLVTRAPVDAPFVYQEF
jgi:D-alanyl-lipoteichoic acid acyltransferase DltB (MBOAT superfamily)